MQVGAVQQLTFFRYIKVSFAYSRDEWRRSSLEFCFVLNSNLTDCAVVVLESLKMPWHLTLI